MTEVFPEDDCCQKNFQKSSRDGKISGDSWTCKRCGCEWRGSETVREGGAVMRVWRPHEMIEVFRP